MANDITTSEFEILNQFIKDLSFEAPSSPRIFFEKTSEAPKVETQFEVKTTNSGDNLYEVNLHVILKNTTSNDTLFLIELSYSAMVAVKINSDNDAISEILIRRVAPYLYPFAREIIANIIKDSGFPPFVMAPVDFDKIEIFTKNSSDVGANSNSK